MGEAAILLCSDRQQWRQWLSDNFQTAKEIWLVFPAKSAETVSVSYNDAVEEALCFGWIDGRTGTLDQQNMLRRFTPRRKGSSYSQPNIERLKWLDEQGMIHPQIRPLVEDVLKAPFVFPEDIIEAIHQDQQTWNNYQNFSESYRRIRLAYIEAARKRPAEFTRRLESFLKKTRENKLISGYGGIDKYYR